MRIAGRIQRVEFHRKMKSAWKKKLLLTVFFLLCIGICFLYYSVSHYAYHITQDNSLSIHTVQAYSVQKEEYSVEIENQEQEYFQIQSTEANIYLKVPLKTQDVQKRDHPKLSRDQTYSLNEAEGNRWYTPTVPNQRILRHRYKQLPELYVFSLSYMDQMSWASTRWRSLQCWAGQLSQRYNVHLIEPFVINGTHLGVPPTHVNQSMHEILKFGDIFDISLWQRSVSNGSFPINIVSWEAFLSSGARNVVTVQIVYPYHSDCTENRQTDIMCNDKRMQRLFSEHLPPNNFILMKSICINFRELDILTIEQFNDMILDNIPENLSVTIMFDEWRGLGEKSCIAHINGGNCSVYNKSFIDATLKLMTPSSRIKSAAHKYTERYLRRQKGYAAIMIRWEKILLYDFYSYHNTSQHYSGSSCLKRIMNYVKHLHKKQHIDTFFLTTDVGKYGSSTFGLYNSTKVSTSMLAKYTQRLLIILNHSKSLNLKKYEQAFEKVSGTTNPAFISQLQKAIAVRARCLLLVGWGSFLTNTLDMYKNMHKKQLCYKYIRLC